MSPSASRFRGLVLTGFGINCDYETAHALELAGFEADLVHLNDLAADREKMDQYHLLVVPGGFSWADDHGAGVLLAHRLRSLAGELKDFVDSGRLVIGICNGFQALVNLGILPALDNLWRREVALIANDCGNFRDDWVTLSFNPACPSVFTRGLETMDLPVRHGEGKLYARPETLIRLEEEHLVAARYAMPDGRPAKGRFPFNPNGSLGDIAALSDPSGRVLGVMPHPEAHHHLTNHPHWARRVDAVRRRGQAVDWRGDGLKIFDNARRCLESGA